MKRLAILMENSLLLFNFIYAVNILIKGFSRARKLYSHKTDYWSMELEAVSFNSYELMFIYLFRASVQIIDVCISPVCSIILCLILWLPFFSSTACKFRIQFTDLWKSCITWQKCYPYKFSQKNVIPTNKNTLILYCAATMLTSWHLFILFYWLHVALCMKPFKHKPRKDRHGIWSAQWNLNLASQSESGFQLCWFLSGKHCSLFLSKLLKNEWSVLFGVGVATVTEILISKNKAELCIYLQSKSSALVGSSFLILQRTRQKVSTYSIMWIT